MYLVAIHVIFFCLVSVYVFAHFFFIGLLIFLLSSKSSLYIMGTNSLSGSCYKYFLPICVLLFIF